MIPAFDRPDGPAAPHPHTVVRHTLTAPPAPALVQAASAWRADLRPARRASPWPLAAALAVCCALLAGWLAARPPPSPAATADATQATRSAAR